MNKLGWGILIVICALLGGFVALLSWGGVVVTAPGAGTAAVTPQPPAMVKGALLSIPVQGVPREMVRDSWGDPRDNGKRAHHGTDIPAAPGTAVTAAASGTVEKLWTSAAGGTAIYVRSPRRRWVYYYAHLSGYAPGLHEGQVVRTGDVIGYVGDTGNAGAGNYHLHFGLTRTDPAERWYQGFDIDPYPLLAGKAVGS